MTYKDYVHGLEELTKHAAYWLNDLDYSQKYTMLFDYESSTRETRIYLEYMMKFMLDASRRIFGQHNNLRS